MIPLRLSGVIQSGVPRPRSRTSTFRVAGPHIRFAEQPAHVAESADAVGSRISRAHFTHVQAAKATALVADRFIGFAGPNAGIAVRSTAVAEQAGPFADRPARIAALQVHFAAASHRVKSLSHSFFAAAYPRRRLRQARRRNARRLRGESTRRRGPRRRHRGHTRPRRGANRRRRGRERRARRNRQTRRECDRRLRERSRRIRRWMDHERISRTSACSDWHARCVRPSVSGRRSGDGPERVTSSRRAAPDHRAA